MSISMKTGGLAAALLFLLAGPALAAGGEYDIKGADLSLLWGVPFVGILLSIAIFPLAAPSFWHHHFGKIAAFWAAAFLVPFALTYGTNAAIYQIVHVSILEYIPFIVLLFALFTVAGGILIGGNIHGSPVTNTVILAIGTLLASVIGTTGASMVLIRPIIRANDDRKYNVHVVIFFIFLVSNIGGSLTPLGDPPLFLGFLKGVDFFWTTKYMLFEMAFCSIILLGLFFALDTHYYRKEQAEGIVRRDPSPDNPIHFKGLVNVPLLLAIIAAILISAAWKPGVTFDIFGTPLELQYLARDIALLAIAGISMAITSKALRDGNGFNWGPIAEVAKLFAGIFLTIIPVIAILKAGKDGQLAALVSLVTNPDGTPNNVMYFWMTGILSSFLDNAPTYLVFFNLAGANPQELMTTLSTTLLAISCGAVFMGANTYIGNAPNFMVKAIAEDMKVKMPSFFGYMAWSGAILVPTFILLTLVVFW